MSTLSTFGWVACSAKRTREGFSGPIRELVPPGGVRVGATDLGGKRVRTGADPGSVFAMRMSWHKDNPDQDGAWSWGLSRKWSAADWNEVIHPKLAEWGRLTWGEIDRFSSDSGHKMHHNMETDVICVEARTRLKDIERYADIIFRFRLGNKRRLWGFRIVDRFGILWFDPTHQIYPTDPD